MEKLISLWVFTSLIFASSFAQDNGEMSARNLLAEQKKQWNAGNLPAFMNTYWQSDSLIFIGKGGITYGWQKTLDNYKMRYPDTAAMGKLDFELLEIKSLSATYIFVVGKWHLTRSIGDIGGSFTLLIHRDKHRWVIVADHTS